jgi:hypothetical protein
MKRLILAGIAVAAFGICTIVPDANALSRWTPRINAKQVSNARATVQGVRNGSLSIRERALLKAGRTRTHNMTQRFKADGRLGLGERLILNGRANRGHRAITGLSNN